MREPRDYLRAMRRYWALVLASLLVSLATATLYIVLVTPEYDATTQLYVSARGPGQDTSDLEQGSSYARSSVYSYVRIVGTASVLGPVISEISLPLTVSELAEDITAEVPADTSMITITARAPSAELAPAIANSVSESLTRVIQEDLEISSPPAEGEEPVQMVRVTVVDPATSPERPAVPRIALVLTVAVVEGLVAGAVLALLLSSFDTRVRTRQDAERAATAPVLGSVPKEPRPAPGPIPGVSVLQGESYRNIRTNLQFLAREGLTTGAGQVFVVSSSRVAEGKSTITANLGHTLASAGHRVVVVDADLRIPQQAEQFAIEGAAGLTDVLIDRAPVREVLHPWGEYHLHVLPSGPVPPNPSELLGREAMAAVIEDLRASHDFILIDSPPVLAVTDAAVVAKHSDGLLLIVSVDGTRRHEVEGAARNIRAAGAELRGVILNRVDRRGPEGNFHGASQNRYLVRSGSGGGLITTDPSG